MSNCTQCQKEMVNFESIYDDFQKRLTELYTYKQTKCPNFRLVQVGA